MTAHTFHVHPANYPDNKPAHFAEHLDRFTARQLRWAYRLLRRDGVAPSTARMIVHSAYCTGVVIGHRAAHVAFREQRMAVA